ncbi:hypothetical protein N8I77_012735 [Diaporthe amygdali]|uniref:N-alpha-acetyltransferase 40 n=1 Tax=Phomopsis amygdali TaxID=1214568 RepID=A0AAD9S2L6_PHOAM|nr:hypothetical protein N8I77_012735 [Diaporthe amygdali]
MKRPRRLEQMEQALRTANRKSDHHFIQDFLLIPYVPRAPWNPAWTNPRTGDAYSLCLCQPRKTMTSPELDACFALVQATSQSDYEGSSRGWNPSAKREEMWDPDLRYILVKDSHFAVQGFTSLMPTIEEGQPVIYCYEIHLKPGLRGTGLAKLLIELLETVAYNIDVVDKVMLTVFTCNKRALEFYLKCGFVRDGISPQPRMLRGGKVKMPDYEILSKRIEHRLLPAAKSTCSNDVTGETAPSQETEVEKGDGESTVASPRPAKIAKLDRGEIGL